MSEQNIKITNYIDEDTLKKCISKYRIVECVYRDKSVFRVEELVKHKKRTIFGNKKETWKLYELKYSLEDAKELIEVCVEYELNDILLETKEYKINISIEPLKVEIE